MEIYMAMMSKLDKWLEQKIAGSLKLSKASIPDTFTLHPVKKHTDFAQIFLAIQKENFEETIKDNEEKLISIRNSCNEKLMDFKNFKIKRNWKIIFK